MERAAAEQVAMARGWLAAQPERVQVEVLRSVRLIQISPRDYLYQIDDAGGGIYGLAAGGLGIYVTSVHSGPHLAHIVRPGAWFSDSAILRGGRRMASVQALEPATALYTPLASLEALAQGDATVALSLASLSGYGVRFAAAVVADLLIRRADQRIAATLLRVTGAQYGIAPDDPAGYRLSQSELGEMANASRHVVNRTLGRFEEAGWLCCGYNRIVVRDKDALTCFVRAGG